MVGTRARACAALLVTRGTRARLCAALPVPRGVRVRCGAARAVTARIDVRLAAPGPIQIEQRCSRLVAVAGCVADSRAGAARDRGVKPKLRSLNRVIVGSGAHSACLRRQCDRHQLVLRARCLRVGGRVARTRAYSSRIHAGSCWSGYGLSSTT